MNRIYVSKSTGILLLILMILCVVLAGYILFSVYGVSKLRGPGEEFKPILGLKQVKDASVEVNGKVASATTQNPGKVLTIVFFYDGYISQQAALVDIEVLKEALKLTEPFKSMEGYVEFKVFTTDERKCKVENKILVCNKDLIESFRKLGVNNFKVVLLSQDQFESGAEFARGRNSWISVSSAQGSLTPEDHKRWLGIQFMHKLGHSLGLYYEYDDPEKMPERVPPTGVSVQGLLNQYGKPNCAPDIETARSWWGTYDSLFEGIEYKKGCGGSKDNIYPEANTLMSSFPQKEGYGIVSTDYLRGILSCFYGGGENIVFPAGKEATYSASLRSCDAFTQEYPNFWNE